MNVEKNNLSSGSSLSSSDANKSNDNVNANKSNDNLNANKNNANNKETKKIKSKVNFHIIEWYTQDEDRQTMFNGKIGNTRKQWVVYMFGRTLANSKRICVIVDDYNPYFYIKLPTGSNPESFKNAMKSAIERHIDYGISRGQYDSAYEESVKFDEWKYENLNIFDGYQPEPVKMLKIVVSAGNLLRGFANYIKNRKCRETLKKIFENDNVYLPSAFVSETIVYDTTKFDPILKFCIDAGVNTCGWCFTENYIVNDPKKKKTKTKTDIEIKCKISDLHPINNTDIVNKMPCVLALSYDIECMSDNPDLLPVPEIKANEIIQIGMTFIQYSKEFSERYILHLKNADPLNNPKDIPIKCDNEKDLLIKFANLINDKKPDMVYGYNIHGFDDNYIYKRLLQYPDIRDLFLSTLSQMNNISAELTKMELSSSGVGNNVMYILKIPGILSIDVMKEIQKDPLYKFSDYKLETVSENLLGEHKNDLPPKQIFSKFASGSKEDIATIANYCIQDCELVHKLVAKIGIIPGKIGMARVCHVPLSYIIFRGQGIKALGLVAFEMKNNNVFAVLPIHGYEENSEGASSFAGAFVFNPIPGYYPIVIVLDFNSLYPSIMIANNLSNETFIKDDKYAIEGTFDEFEYIEKYEKDNPELGKVTYTKNGQVSKRKQKAIIIENVKNKSKFLKRSGVDKNGKTIDNTGLLPKILQKLLAERARVRGEQGKINKIVDILKEFKEHKNEFLNKDDAKALTELIKKTKIEIKILNEAEILIGETKYKISNSEEIDASIKDLKLTHVALEAMQLAYKITANSIYGQCGSPTSSIYCGPISATVTSIGRHLIYNVAAKYVEETYGEKCIYGDTDSIFVNLQNMYKKMVEGKTMTPELQAEVLLNGMNLGVKMADEITKKINKQPMKIVFEKLISPLILMKKKNYCGKWYEGFESIGHPKFKMMGCAPKKRDYCPLVSKLFKKTIDILIDTSKTTKRNAKEALCNLYQKLIHINKLPIEEFVMTKSLKEKYKDSNRVAHKVLADRIMKRNPGSAISPNTRLPFVYTITDPINCPLEFLSSTGRKKREAGSKKSLDKKDILTGYRIETPEFVTNSNGQLKIDYDEYILKQIGKPIIADLLRLSVPLECLNYVLYKVLMWRNGECGRVSIRIHEKEKIMPSGDKDTISDVKIGIIKKSGTYVLQSSDYYYVNFLKSSKEDIDNEILIITDS